MVTLCGTTIIANLTGKQIKVIQEYLAIYSALFAVFILSYA